MDKNISFITMDASFVQWLLDTLRIFGPETKAAKELSEAIDELTKGNARILIVELEKEQQTQQPQREESKSAPVQREKAAKSQKHIIRCGDLLIDAKSKSVFKDEEEISLTQKEFEILYFLIRNRGEAFTKQQIYRAVWEKDYVPGNSNVMAFIRKLRKKIETNPDTPEYILTVWGVGYKFNDHL